MIRRKAAEIVTSTLPRIPRSCGIFSTNDQGEIGAITGFASGRSIGRVKLVRLRFCGRRGQRLQEQADLCPHRSDQKREGEMSVEIAKKILDGQPVEKQVLLRTRCRS